jgi:hypothetical protein
VSRIHARRIQPIWFGGKPTNINNETRSRTDHYQARKNGIAATRENRTLIFSVVGK